MKKLLFLVSMLSVSALMQAQTVNNIKGGISASVNGQHVEIRFYDESLVRVTKSEKPDAELSAVPVVTMQPKDVEVKTLQSDGVAVVSSHQTTASLSLTTGRVTVQDASGRIFIAEKDYGTLFFPAQYSGQPATAVRQAFLLDADEQVYGLGQQQEGRFSQRNCRFQLHQENMQIGMPYFYSTRGYGLLWNNASPTMWADCPNETSFESEMGEAVDYFVIAAGSADGVMAGLRQLTGQSPMNALWTYGFWQSKERYGNQEEIVDAVRRYRQLGVPLDGIVQDWQYWGHTWTVWNGLTWTKEEYPDPHRMMDEIHSLHAHAIASVWPSFGFGTHIYRDFKDRGYMLGITTWPDSADVYDVYNPEARRLYWDYLNENMFSTGLDGWWLDATEPEMPRRGEELDVKTFMGPLRKNANAFPVYTISDVHANQRKVCSDKRVFILTRSAYLGQQRTGAVTWSGDIDARWDVLARQIPAGLSFSLCGNPYWNTDLGGFWVRDYDGCNDPRYRELYVRWLQFGTFMPMMRSHGTNTPREIWNFGDRGDWAFDAIEKSIRLRYALLPYIYSTAWQVSSNAETFMRPLVMDFPADRRVENLGSEYLFGRSLLVAPVTEAAYVSDDKVFHADAKAVKDVYLPKGCGWYDLHTGEHHAGGTTVSRHVPIDEIPVYVREGSIVPVGPDVQYSSEKKWDNLLLTVYPGADADFTLYEDEGDNYNYERGQYTEIPIHWDDAARTLTIGARQGSFSGMLAKRTFRVNVVGGRSFQVKYSGKTVTKG